MSVIRPQRFLSYVTICTSYAAHNSVAHIIAPFDDAVGAAINLRRQTTLVCLRHQRLYFMQIDGAVCRQICGGRWKQHRGGRFIDCPRVIAMTVDTVHMQLIASFRTTLMSNDNAHANNDAYNRQ